MDLQGKIGRRKFFKLVAGLFSVSFLKLPWRSKAAEATTVIPYHNKAALETFYPFAPHDLVLTFESNMPLDRETLVQLANRYLSNYDPFTIDPDRIQLFESGSRHWTSLYAELPTHDDDGIIDCMFDLEQPSYAETETEIQLRSVSPNWLVSSAPDPNMGTGGGPAARPVMSHVQPQFATAPIAALDAPWNFRLPDLSSGAPEGVQRAYEIIHTALLGRMDGIAPLDIVIMDTAPQPENLRQAYYRFRHKNPLIASLLRPNGKLNVTYYQPFAFSDDDPPYMGGYDQKRTRPDKMPWLARDHGLFNAGVIHSLAPHANIHLIQSLNDFGFGTAESMIWAKLKGRHIAKSRGLPILLNMSLVYQYPVEGHHEYHFEPINNDERLVNRLFNESGFAERMSLPTKVLTGASAEAVDLAQPHKTIHYNAVIGAAGNDGRDGIHPSARFPAALPQVIGVGALDHKQAYATYTNKGDRPLNDGFAVFGGEVNADNPLLTDEKYGMLGIYTADFPDPTVTLEDPLGWTKTVPNETGWARWAGTSFSTALTTGLIAMLASQGMTVNDAIGVLRDASGEGSGNKESRLPIVQNATL